MNQRTSETPRPQAARPWRVWMAMTALLSLLVFYDSARFQRFLLDAELQAVGWKAALAPKWAHDAVGTAHGILGRLVAFWEGVETAKRVTGITALIELERGLTRGAADLLVLDLVEASAEPARDSGDAPARGLSVIEPDPGADGQAVRPPVFLLVGDSVMLSPLGTYVGEKLQRSLGGRVVRRGVVGTGLSRPDKFDWTAQLRKLIAQHSPRAVVVLMGVNDVNATRNAAGQLEAFGSAAFRATYAQNVRGFLRAAQQEGVEVIWVETPVTENPELNERLKTVNDLQRTAAAGVAGARYVETWSLLADSDGRPRPFLRLDNERQFHPWNIDGIHLTSEAGKYVADAIFPRMTSPETGASPAAASAGISPPPPEPAGPVRRYRYLSRLVGRDTDLFFLPGAAPRQPSAAALLILYRRPEPALERWVGQALLPLVRRFGVSALVQQEPLLLEPGGRPRPWPDTPRALEQYLAEVRRAAERAGEPVVFGGLMVVGEGDPAGAGISLLARANLPCMSLLVAPPPPARTGPNPARPAAAAPADVEEPLAVASPGRMAGIAREISAAPNSPFNRALRERLRPAGFIPRAYGGTAPGQGWEAQVARQIAWHGLCERLRERTWPGGGGEGGKALFDAIEQDLPDMAATLLARGVSSAERDPEGNTPLIRAVRANRREIVPLLLAGGADPDLRNDEGWSALAWAAARGNLPLAQRLLDAKARVDIRDRQGRTPLMVAAWHGFPGMVDVLAQAQARVDAHDRTGETALHKAAKYGMRTALERLVAVGANVNQADPRGKTALMTAAFYGQTEAAAALMGYGAALDARDRGGWSALMVAASRGHPETVRLLAERGADPLAVANDRKTALILAACEGHAALVPYLVSLRVEREARDVGGQTALLCAARKGRTAAVRALLQAGAAVDAADSQGTTGLLMASRGNGIELAEALYWAGADPDHRNAAGESPRSVAAAKGHDRILHLFSKGSGRGRRPGAR